MEETIRFLIGRCRWRGQGAQLPSGSGGRIFPTGATSFQRSVSGHMALSRGAQAMARTMKINIPDTRRIIHFNPLYSTATQGLHNILLSRLSSLRFREVNSLLQVRHSVKDFTSTMSHLIHPAHHVVSAIGFPFDKNGGSERLSKPLSHRANSDRVNRYPGAFDSGVCVHIN